jgi:hypothetical protein
MLKIDKTIGMSPALMNEPDISHRAIHLIVNRDTFKIERTDFASSLAKSALALELAKEERSVLPRILRETRDEPTLATLQGHMQFVK